jgi:hypothetical protein
MQQLASALTGKVTTAVLLLSALYTSAALASSFTVSETTIEKHDTAYFLNTRLSYEFDEEVLEAINNGVPLKIIITVRVQQQRDMLWDSTVTEVKQTFYLKYHALSSQYIVRNLNDDKQETFLSSTSAISSIGKVTGLMLVQQEQLADDGKYHVSIEPRMDIESLPAPMRPWAWFSGSWHLIRTGDKTTWPLP